MPSLAAASSTFVPAGTSTSRLSIFNLGMPHLACAGFRRANWRGNDDRVDGTDPAANVAAGANAKVDFVLLIGRDGNRIDRAFLGAPRATDARVGDFVLDEVLALTRRADAFDVGLVFVAEVAQRCDDRVRGRLSEAAEASAGDEVAQFFQAMEVVV